MGNAVTIRHTSRINNVIKKTEKPYVPKYLIIMKQSAYLNLRFQFTFGEEN